MSDSTIACAVRQRRRQLRRIAAALVAVPSFPGAAQARAALIGFLTGTTLDAGMQRTAVERLGRGLRELGYVEGRSIRIALRGADGWPNACPHCWPNCLRSRPTCS